MTEKEAQDAMLGKIRTINIDELIKHMEKAPNCCSECVVQHFFEQIQHMKVYRV
mgnify:CR=1 FL=1